MLFVLRHFQLKIFLPRKDFNRLQCEEREEVSVKGTSMTAKKALIIAAVIIGMPVGCVIVFAAFFIHQIYYQPLTPAKLESILAKHPATIDDVIRGVSACSATKLPLVLTDEEGRKSLDEKAQKTRKWSSHNDSCIRWRGANPSMPDVHWIYGIMTQTVEGYNFSDGGGMRSYYILLNKDGEVLGWGCCPE